MELHNMKEIEEFEEVLENCSGTVRMESALTHKIYDMKNEKDRLVALGKLRSGNGSDLEIYASERKDTAKILNFFVEHMAA